MYKLIKTMENYITLSVTLALCAVLTISLTFTGCGSGGGTTGVVASIAEFAAFVASGGSAGTGNFQPGAPVTLSIGPSPTGPGSTLTAKRSNAGGTDVEDAGLIFVDGGFDCLSPNQIAVADFNGDTFMDFVSVGDVDSCLWRNNGTGTMTAEELVVPLLDLTTTSGTAVSVRDIDDDGTLEIIVGNADTNVIDIYTLVGPAYSKILTFAINVTSAITAIQSGDYNLDGVLDLVVSQDSGSTLLYTGITTTPYALTLTGILLVNNMGAPLTTGTVVGTPVDQILNIDYNRDGRTDLIARNSSGQALLYTGLGDGTFLAGPTEPVELVNLTAADIAVGDLNGDGHDDIYIANLFAILSSPTARPDTLFLSNGFGGLNEFTTAEATLASYITIAQLNGAGGMDVWLGSRFTADAFAINDGNDVTNGIDFDFIPGAPAPSSCTLLEPFPTTTCCMDNSGFIAVQGSACSDLMCNYFSPAGSDYFAECCSSHPAWAAIAGHPCGTI